MSNQSDVIELGSSDDEPEPKRLPKPPRKLLGNQNTGKVKNTPNAMVHIPAGVSIKPAKKNMNPNLRPVNLKPGLKSFIPLKQQPIVPVPVKIRPSYNKPTGNVVTPYGKNIIPYGKNITISNQQKNMNQKIKMPSNINPYNLLKMNAIRPGPSANSKNIQSMKILPRLPAGITITKTKSQMSLKRTATPNPGVVIKKKKLARPLPIETVTVEDEDPLSCDYESKPQWYIPPDQNKETNTNEKPADSNFIEITIEDSPIKPKNKQNNDTAIAVDDCTFKQTKQNNTSGNKINKVKNKLGSKKKLDYITPVPEQEQENNEDCSIEIELVPMTVNNEVQNNVETMLNTKDKTSQQEDVLTKPAETDKPKISKEKTKQKDVTNTNIVMENTNIGDREEFHPVYQQFIDLCLVLENSNDMKIIIDKKIKAYYRQVPKDYTESEDFIDMVQTKMDLMRSVPKDMYLFIKDVVDQLNSQRKREKYAQSSAAKEKNDDNDMVEVPEHDSKRARQIKKLEKTLKKLHRAIQKLEEQEVDFEDDGDSVYILTERYKERVVKVHAKLCQLTNSKMPSLPRVEIECRPGQPSGPAKRLNKWLNRRQPPGTPSPFPDFHDVLRCVREANEKDKLGWNEVDVMEEARDLFTRCGKKLQRRRQENEWRIAASRLTTHEDPANVSAELQTKLEENRKVAAQKESELINKFADRQKQLKLEAEEITEKEAEESPAESEDDVAIISDEENNALQDKERRKQRLVKLLKGKSKHKSDKETKSDNDIIDSKAIDVNNDESNKNDKEDGKETERIESKEEENKTKTDAEAGKTENSISDEKSEDKISSDKDSNELNSDIDELHLLQKHHSESEAQSSDDSFIDISDSMESNSNSVSDNKNSPHSVYSIEDSSSDSNNDQNESLNENSDNENDLNELPDQNEGNQDEAHAKANEIQHNDNDLNKNPTQEIHLNDENSCMTINSESQSIDDHDTNQESKTDDANSKDIGINIQNDNAMDVDYSQEPEDNEENNGLQHSECGNDAEIRTLNSVNDHDMESDKEEAMNVCENEIIAHEKDSNVDKNKTNDNDKIAIENENEINANDNHENETNVQESNKVNDDMFEFEIPLLDNYNSAVDVHLASEL